MSGAYGKARTNSSVTFVSKASHEAGLAERLRVEKELLPVEDTRTVTKADMRYNSYLPHITVDPETYEVRIDGELITCEPADVLPMAQRYFLF
jgi:urease subunit alpha